MNVCVCVCECVNVIFGSVCVCVDRSHKAVLHCCVSVCCVSVCCVCMLCVWSVYVCEGVCILCVSVSVSGCVLGVGLGGF